MDNIPSVIQAKGPLGGSAEKSLPAKQEMGVQSPGQAGDGVQSPGQAGDGGSVPGSSRRWGFSPWVRKIRNKWQPTPAFLPGKPP